MSGPNVLLITIDCLRQDRCGAYGYHRNTTPTLDSVARDSFVFENEFATGPVTAESFPGILAGRLLQSALLERTFIKKTSRW